MKKMPDGDVCFFRHNTRAGRIPMLEAVQIKCERTKENKRGKAETTMTSMNSAVDFLFWYLNLPRFPRGILKQWQKTHPPPRLPW